MARLHEMIETRAELRVGRHYIGQQEDAAPRTWRIEIVDQLSKMRVGLLELTDEQLGQVLGGSPVRDVVAEFIHPAKADRVGRVMYMATTVVKTGSGRLADLDYQKREAALLDGLAGNMGNREVDVHPDRWGIKVRVFGYAVDREYAEGAAPSLAFDLEQALHRLGTHHGPVNYRVSGKD